MDADLTALVSERPPFVAEVLASLGVQTCTDVRYMWASGQAMVASFEENLGVTMIPDDAFQVMLTHSLAAGSANLHQEAVVRCLVDERESVTPGRPVLSLHEATPMPVARSRRVIDTGLAGPVPHLLEAADTDHATREQAKRQMKVHALFHYALEHLVDLRELGTSWTLLNDPCRMQALKDTLMACTDRLSTERISALLAAAKRWHRFAISKAYVIKEPSPLQVADFLRQVGAGGPTAASSMFQALKWFQMNFGTKFHIDHFLIQPYRMHHPTHCGKQQPELEPWEMINLLLLAVKSVGTKQILVLFLLQSAISCIRFEHMQRSDWSGEGPGYLQFTCSKGKSRKKGARPAYSCPL